jgi:hypothetical protein
MRTFQKTSGEANVLLQRRPFSGSGSFDMACASAQLSFFHFAGRHRRNLPMNRPKDRAFPFTDSLLLPAATRTTSGPGHPNQSPLPFSCFPVKKLPVKGQFISTQKTPSEAKSQHDGIFTDQVSCAKVRPTGGRRLP